MMKVQNIPFIINTFVTIAFVSLNISSLWAECNGIPVSFEKLDYADWILPENQDSLAPTVKITRKDNQSLFNIAQEDGYSGNNGSPVGTLWARSITTDANPGDYVNFVAMHGGSGGGGPQSLIGDTVSLYLPDYGIYFDIEFTAYGGGNTGGSFAWTRTCVMQEIVGCQNNTACNYDENATTTGDCVFPDGICDTCSGETDGTGTIVDNDADDDTVCDADEPTGCMDHTRCNYNSAAEFDDGSCLDALDGVCESCSDATDGTGTIVDNDADDDGVCDEDELKTAENIFSPDRITMNPIYPNPFNPSTEISYSIPEMGVVTIKVFNLTGKELETIFDSNLKPGQHSIVWNASSYPAGIFLVRMEYDGDIRTQKAILLK